MILDALLDCVFPRRSLRGEIGTFVTEEESRDLRSWPIRLDQPVLRDMGLRSLDRVVAAGSYPKCPLLRKAIATLKYGRITSLAEELGLLMVRAVPLLGLTKEYKDYKEDKDYTVLCPVPLHFLRKFSRGFNQAELLSEVIVRETGWPMSDLLCRRFPTGSQVRRSRVERKLAVRGAFSCRVSDVPQCVVLVDDVLTSGATLDACALALKEAGAQFVAGLVLALGSDFVPLTMPSAAALGTPERSRGRPSGTSVDRGVRSDCGN